MRWKLPLAFAAAAGIGAVAILNPQARQRVEAALKSATEAAQARVSKDEEAAPGSPAAPAVRWDHTLSLRDDQVEAMGLATVPVTAQAVPSQLRLVGQTDNDPYTLTTIRPQYNCRVEKVHVREGDAVKKGDPLVDLFSAALAEAKSDYESKYIQCIYNRDLTAAKRELAKTGANSKRELVEAENSERKSQVDMKLAKDELLVYGLNEEEIEKGRQESGTQKAKFTIRSPVAGIVIKRDVVQDNLYGTADPLMIISPLKHFWVRGNVNEIDAGKVQLGQALEVVFPYEDLHIPGKVEYIDKAIEPETRAAKFRTVIPNLGDRLKSGMYVRVLLDVPPEEGRTVVPRIAMVAVDRDTYVFIRKPGPGHKFERRPIHAWQEGDDQVIVDKPTKDHHGLSPGEEVVTTGSLLLEQIYEDKSMSETGSSL